MSKAVENPCTSQCKLSDGVCRGCGRSKEEIKTWKGMKRPEKAAVVERARKRLKAIAGKKK